MLRKIYIKLPSSGQCFSWRAFFIYIFYFIIEVPICYQIIKQKDEEFKHAAFTLIHSHLLAIQLIRQIVNGLENLCEPYSVWKEKETFDNGERESSLFSLEKVSLAWKRQFDFILCLFNDSLNRIRLLYAVLMGKFWFLSLSLYFIVCNKTKEPFK